MEVLVATAIAAMTGAGAYLVLQRESFPVVLGLAMLSYAVNLFLFSTGRLVVGQAPVISAEATGYTDPLPQALVLTAIVISFAMTALVVMLALGAFLERGRDTIDLEDDPEARP